MTNFTSDLDTRGLNCPLPILKTRKAMNSLKEGEVLKITATDPGAVKDMSSFCSQTGHELLETAEAAGEYTFLIRKVA